MGNGIVQTVAPAGYQVVMRDINDDVLAKGMKTIEKSLSKLAEKNKINEEDKTNILNRITTSNSINVVSGVDLIIEAVLEILDLKGNIFDF